MANVQLVPYIKYVASALAGSTVWAANPNLTLTLHTSTYTPDPLAHQYVSDLSDELTTGGGYTAGGTVLTTATLSAVAANSWGAARAALTTYQAGKVLRPAAANGYLYRATAGTTAAGLPTYPTTVGQCVTDGTVTLTCIGRQALVLDAANLAPAWAGFTAGPFRHVILSDRTAALPANQPLIGYYSFPSDQVGGGGSFTVTFDTDGGVITIATP